MTITSQGGEPKGSDPTRVRVAAAGDIHLGREGDEDRWRAAFDALRGSVDLVLLVEMEIVIAEDSEHGHLERAAGVGQDLGLGGLSVGGQVTGEQDQVEIVDPREGRLHVLAVLGTAVDVASRGNADRPYHRPHSSAAISLLPGRVPS